MKDKMRLPDQETRRRIASEFDKSFFVEAGAGSGKTKSLVDRMAGLVRFGHAGIENIAAVTFTRKAAAELRERFQIELERILNDGNAPREEKDRVGQALSRFEQATVTTIHSFCARILRERPVEAGIDPGFEEIEEEDDGIFAENVWNEYLEKQAFENSEAMRWMIENDIEPQSAADIYQELIKYPDIEIVRERREKPEFAEVKKNIRTYFSELGKKLPCEEPEKGWDALQKLIRRVPTLIGMKYLEDDRLFVEILKILGRKAGVTQNRWPDKLKAKGYAEDFVKFQETVIAPSVRLWREYLHQPLVDFALGGASYYAEWRRDRSALNFQDLLMKTAALLRGNREVRAWFKTRIRYLLVDEFQDTDPIQAEIAMLLAGKDDGEADWRKAKPKPGALFLVGDPKQSIYRFRRADIDIYNQVKRIFGGGAGEVVELTTNFRSLKPIEDITNTVFGGLFPGGDTRHQAKFAPLNTVRPETGTCPGGVFVNRIAKVDGNKAKDIVDADAEIIAEWIRRAVDGGLRLEHPGGKPGESCPAEPGDFMIIAKRKKNLSVYAKALEARGVPYAISGGESFGDSEELHEIIKILKAVADPADPVAVTAALRGLYVGASDNDLYEFARDGGTFSYVRKQDKGPEIIRAALRRIRGYHEIAGSKSPVTAVEMIVEDLGTIPLAMSEEMGSSRAGNVLKAVELLRGRKPDSTCGFAELVGYLADLREKSKTEEMGLFPATSKAVRIMNLHKAKGLEAPVVILADPSPQRGSHEPDRHIVRTGAGSRGYFAVTRKLGDYASELIALPAEWETHAAEEKEYENAEKDRLDYVAVTRAKNILAVSVYKDSASKTPWESLYSYLEHVEKLPSLDETPALSGEKRFFAIKRDEWEAERETMAAEIRRMTAASYRVRSVTDMAEKPDIFSGEALGSGAGWGNAVHRALEYCARGMRDRLDAAGAGILEENGLKASDIGRLLAAVDTAMSHDLWKRMAAVREKYFEVPLSTMDDGTIVRGVIDMIFKEDGEWVIVDFKTDDFERDSGRKAAYERQLDHYARFWTGITGEKVKAKHLMKV
ncbi:MAG: UvrD-helicase domain-containing protein [Acidobacteriota bacterium]|nr:UvrD-helicase domain-containing protein [Acidobacteriota bacterium]